MELEETLDRRFFTRAEKLDIEYNNAATQSAVQPRCRVVAGRALLAVVVAAGMKQAGNVNRRRIVRKEETKRRRKRQILEGNGKAGTQGGRRQAGGSPNVLGFEMGKRERPVAVALSLPKSLGPLPCSRPRKLEVGHTGVSVGVGVGTRGPMWSGGGHGCSVFGLFRAAKLLLAAAKFAASIALPISFSAPIGPKKPQLPSRPHPDACVERFFGPRCSHWPAKTCPSFQCQDFFIPPPFGLLVGIATLDMCLTPVGVLLSEGSNICQALKASPPKTTGPPHAVLFDKFVASIFLGLIRSCAEIVVPLYRDSRSKGLSRSTCSGGGCRGRRGRNSLNRSPERKSGPRCVPRMYHPSLSCSLTMSRF